MAFVAQPTRSVGDDASASDFDSLTQPVCRFRGMVAASQVVTTVTNIPLTATVDPYSGYSAGSKLWTVPANAGGSYTIMAQLKTGVSAAAIAAAVIINGSGAFYGESTASAAGVVSSVHVTGVTLAAGDTVALQSIGGYTSGTAGIDQWLSLTRNGNS